MYGTIGGVDQFSQKMQSIDSVYILHRRIGQSSTNETYKIIDRNKIVLQYCLGKYYEMFSQMTLYWIRDNATSLVYSFSICYWTNVHDKTSSWMSSVWLLSRLESTYKGRQNQLHWPEQKKSKPNIYRQFYWNIPLMYWKFSNMETKTISTNKIDHFLLNLKSYLNFHRDTNKSSSHYNFQHSTNNIKSSVNSRSTLSSDERCFIA